MATKESEKEKGKRKEGDNIMEFKEEIISLSLTFCDFYSKQSPPPVCVCVGDSPYWILRFASLFLPHFVFYTLPYSRRSWPHIPSSLPIEPNTNTWELHWQNNVKKVNKEGTTKSEPFCMLGKRFLFVDHFASGKSLENAAKLSGNLAMKRQGLLSLSLWAFRFQVNEEGVNFVKILSSSNTFSEDSSLSSSPLPPPSSSSSSSSLSSSPPPPSLSSSLHQLNFEWELIKTFEMNRAEESINSLIKSEHIGTRVVEKGIWDGSLFFLENQLCTSPKIVEQIFSFIPRTI